MLSSATHLYFDHPHEADPNDRGLYWATRVVGLQKVFGFMPSRYLDNVDELHSGKKISKTEACAKKLIQCLDLTKPDNIIGEEIVPELFSSNLFC